MTAFTPEQQTILRGITRIISLHLRDLFNLIHRTNMQLVTLHNILGEKGVITADDWNAATAAVRAAFAVDLATNPQLQTLDDELGRLLEDGQGEGRHG